MKKTYKKSFINNLIKENKLEELVDKNGSLINPSNNYVQNRNYIKSKKTTDDFVKNSTQGPEAYFIYGGPYYGVNYSYVVNEEDDLLDTDDFYDELNVVPNKKYDRSIDSKNKRNAKHFADKDIKKHFNKPSDPVYDHLPVDKWRGHSLDYDTEFDFDLYEGEENMKSLVDEIMIKKRNQSNDVVKKMREQDIIGDEITIPDVSELKTVHEKPMVIRKINSLLDLINKENLKGDELSILLNHIVDNIDIYSIDDKHREIIGDKIKYGEEGR